MLARLGKNGCTFVKWQKIEMKANTHAYTQTDTEPTKRQADVQLIGWLCVSEMEWNESFRPSHIFCSLRESISVCMCVWCVCKVYHTQDKGASEQFARGQFPCNFVDNLCRSTNEVDMRPRSIPNSHSPAFLIHTLVPLFLSLPLTMAVSLDSVCTLPCI